MNISLYVAPRTVLHALDGRTKVLMALSLCLLALCFSHPLFLMALFGLVVGLLGFSGAQANVRKMWVLTTLLFCYSVVLWPFFVDGETPVPGLDAVGVTVEGVMVGLAMGLRLLVMLWAGIWLLSVTAIEELAFALERLGLPSRASFAFSLAFRWVSILLGAGVSVVQAQRSRGLDVGAGGIADRLRKYVPLVVPLIGQALRQTQMLAMGLESKGFHPFAIRRNSLPKTFLNLDYVVLGLLCCLLVLALWLRMNGVGVLRALS
ncbi:MAG: energy-coupling factor transporter transmembrane protein EcfT [Nitrospira sp.]|nr:energy-coupling factor transporter transmembrane protein EcfT [Nitrospira sp.]MCB9710872.1 energy-coupling factor transporter transmembrane protein EcfT [Nitrospiraceae bacterium]MDR4486508.1 energy-coupling factor transporter transmembrane protein EcfT [Nitrospirales bacterium]MCA9465730.1 energy-coupling factor transporter transmembrane protein EcfT [Nitrospira sp.]MCA9475130.1 energy-coupling factor transporter transmembrane protein EcfT [Nitrospira sp.]